MSKTEEVNRYTRQTIMKEIGEEGQQKLAEASVLIVGAGGLGSPAAMYLASAGVGTIGIADCDTVDITNLNRQLLHSTADIGDDKAISAKQTLDMINPNITVNAYNMRLTADNIADVIKDYDFIIEATDNFPSKFLINDACVLMGKPFVHGGVLGFSGQVMTYVPDRGVCYRCIFKEIPKKGTVPTAKQVGIIGAAAGVVGSLQALEAIKYITGAGELLTGCMLTIDTLTMDIRRVPFPKIVDDCPVCGENQTIICLDEENYKFKK